MHELVDETEYTRITIAEARRLLVLACMNSKFKSKTILDVKHNPECEIFSRSVSLPNQPAYTVLDVAGIWQAFNPAQFSCVYKYRRVFMGEDQRDISKCERILDKYPSLEFRRQTVMQSSSNTFKPMLSCEDLLEFMTSPFFTTKNQAQGKAMPYKLCIFEEDVVSETLDLTRVIESTSTVESIQSKKLALGLQTFKATRLSLQDVRELQRNDETLSKRRRIENIKVRALENVLAFLVDANVQLNDVLQQQEQ